MPKPTSEELETALAEAARMREQQEDPFFLAKTLLNHNYRLGILERVLAAAKHYLHSGLAPHEHALLERAIAEADRASVALGNERERFGLE
jgi:hypothetical protein